MSITLSREGNGEIILQPGFPPATHRTRYPLFDHYHAYCDNLLVIQQKRLGDRGIYHVELSGTKTDTLVAQYNKGVLVLHVSLDNSIVYKVEGLEPITLHQRGLCCYYVPFWLARVRAGMMNHRSLLVCVPISTLAPYRLQALGAATLLQHAAAYKPYLLTRTPAIVPESLLTMIDKAMESHDTFELDHHLDSIVEMALDLLFHQPRPKAVNLHLEDVARIYEVKDLIVNNLHIIYTLQQIGAATQLSRWKLRNWFPMIFGVSIQDFSQQVRMSAATRQLREGEKLQAIARSLGYCDANTFRQAFVGYYDCSPTEYSEMCR